MKNSLLYKFPVPQGIAVGERTKVVRNATCARHVLWKQETPSIVADCPAVRP
jgi:hypothetical protein